MQSMLEELYMGNIGFDAGYYGQNSPFVKAARKKLDSMEKLQPSVQKAKASGADRSSLVEHSVDENIRAVAGELISESPLVAHLVENEKITIIGAKYFQETGEVEFFE